MNPCTQAALVRGAQLRQEIEAEILDGSYDPSSAQDRITAFVRSTRDCPDGGHYWASRPMLTFATILPIASGQAALAEYRVLTSAMAPAGQGALS